jgi:hypothetical protein
MYITTFAECGMKPETFIRVNKTLSGACIDAIEDTKTDLEDYATQNGDQEMDCIGGEDETGASIVRIINPNTGYEYQAYIIRKSEVGA